jgi:hypothetical protein
MTMRTGVRRIGCLACVVLCVWLGLPAAAQEPLTPADRTFLVDYLVRTQRLYRDEVSGVSPEQWRFKPLPQRWSLAECAEHIILAERWLLAEFRDKFAKTSEPAYIFHWRTPKPTPADVHPVPRALRAQAYRDRIAREIDRSKVDPSRAPEGDPPEPSLVPRFRFATPEDAIAAFDATRAETIALVRTTTMDLYNAYVYPGTSERLLDGYEYLLRLPAHSERHVAQMREVKAHPAFPPR